MLLNGHELLFARGVFIFLNSNKHERKIFKVTLYLKVVLLFLAGVSSTYAAGETQEHTAVFNQQWLKTLVSIEVVDDKQRGNPVGSGFLVETPNKHIALITAKHVVYEDEGKGKLRERLAYRLNDVTGGSVLVNDDDANLFVKSGWVKSGKSDLALRLIVRKETTDFITIPYSLFILDGKVEAGAPLFIIGFPFGLRSETYATPIVRRGIVGRKDADNIIVDGFVYPGNSGGPVIYEPTIQLGTGFTTPILQGDWLVGIVLSEITYIEPAISPQTKRPRIIFEKNSGLCNVLPASTILELLKGPEFIKIDSQTN